MTGRHVHLLCILALVVAATAEWRVVLDDKMLFQAMRRFAVSTGGFVTWALNISTVAIAGADTAIRHEPTLIASGNIVAELFNVVITFFEQNVHFVVSVPDNLTLKTKSENVACKGNPIEIFDKDIGHCNATYASLAIRCGMDVDRKDHRSGLSALDLAAFWNCPEIVDLLVDAGAKVDGINNDGMPLFSAINIGSEKSAKALLDKGANIGLKAW